MNNDFLNSCTFRPNSAQPARRAVYTGQQNPPGPSSLRARTAAIQRAGAALTAAAMAMCLLVCAPAARAQAPQEHYGASVAVFPFEVFSIEKEPALGADVAAMISKQLALNPSIVCIDGRRIDETIQTQDYPSLDTSSLRRIAKLLNANCIILGTITKIRDEHSIDIEMFTTATEGPNFKTFAEGLEIKSLSETIAAALDQEIMRKIDSIPPAERPRVHSRSPSSLREPSSDGFDVERELTAAFGPMQSEQPAQADAAVAGPAADEARAEHPIAEETISEEMPPEPRQPDRPTDSAPARQQTADVQPETPVDREAGQPAPGASFFELSKAISISSDSMEYDNRRNMALFRGNVVARQDDIVMFANTMRVFYSGSGGLSRVEALGDVRAVQGDRIATGSSIVFNKASQTIVATGNPRVWQGDNVVHGTKITVFLKEERTVVEGAPGDRASATIYPGSEKKRP